MSNKKQTFGIVGGGMLGLTLAYELAKKGHHVSVIEKGKDFGGLAGGFSFAGTTIDKYYHHWFRSDNDIQQLIQELGLESKMLWLESNVGILLGGKIYDFSTGLDLLKFPPLGIFDRLRAAIVSFFLQKFKDHKRFEQFTALEWCRKYYGKNVTRVIWEPLLKGKFGSNYTQISMAWLWARIHDRSSSRPNPLGKEYLGYIDGGFQVVVGKLVEKCRELGVELLNESEITGHEYASGKHTLIINSKPKSFDKLVATVPGQIFTKIFQLPETEQKRINSVQYLGAVEFILILKQSFMKNYWLNINEPDFPFLVVIEHTNFMKKEQYQEKVVLYVAKYLSVDDELFKLSEDDLFQKYVKYLSKINPDFNESWVEKKYFLKAAFAQHIVTKGYKPLQYMTSIPGLYLANFSQIYPHDRGTNYAVAQAKQLLDLII